jgi:hypothetical protein
MANIGILVDEVERQRMKRAAGHNRAGNLAGNEGHMEGGGVENHHDGELLLLSGG